MPRHVGDIVPSWALHPAIEHDMSQVLDHATSAMYDETTSMLDNTVPLGEFLDEQIAKVWENANIETDNDSKNGEVIISDKKEGLFVKTSKGVLQLLEVQGENGKRMDIKSFRRWRNYSS